MALRTVKLRIALSVKKISFSVTGRIIGRLLSCGEVRRRKRWEVSWCCRWEQRWVDSKQSRVSQKNKSREGVVEGSSVDGETDGFVVGHIVSLQVIGTF